MSWRSGDLATGVTSAGTPLTIDCDRLPGGLKLDRFDSEAAGAYDGGSSLVPTGDLDADNYLRLYRTELAVKSGSTSALTYLTDDVAPLSAAVTFADDPTGVVRISLAPGGSDHGITGASEATTGDGQGAAARAEPEAHAGGASRAPTAPAGFPVREALTGTDNIGGIRDAVLYIPQFHSDQGIPQLRAVGPDGQESRPALIRYGFRAGPDDVTSRVEADGTIAVGWEHPAGRDAGVAQHEASSEGRTTTVAPRFAMRFAMRFAKGVVATGSATSRVTVLVEDCAGTAATTGIR